MAVRSKSERIENENVGNLRLSNLMNVYSPRVSPLNRRKDSGQSMWENWMTVGPVIFEQRVSDMSFVSRQ
jgi:hypothetical protein